MKFEPIQDVPRLHTTPLATIRIEYPRVVIEADDEHERRFRLLFEPYQALRVVTEDCFDTPGGLAIIPQTVVEVKDSRWVHELQSILVRNDHQATFLTKARHFLLPLQEDFLEIVAWNVRCEAIENS